MINGSTLKTTNERVRIADPNASMQGLKDDMEFFNRGEKYRLPIEIVLDTAKFGGLFNSSTQDCMIIRNKEHLDDYFQHCIVCTRTGRTSTLELKYFGGSKLIGQANKTEERKGSFRGMLMNSVFRVNEEALNAEYEYYQLLTDLFKECFT